MPRFRTAAALIAAALFLLPERGPDAASHREAPITAIDRTADITDFYAFVSYDDPGAGPRKVTLILSVDPLLEPANGPNYFPFDEHVLYAVHVDNNHDALEDVSFEFRFKTEQRLPGVPVGIVGAGAGVSAPSNSPPPVAPGTPLIPPRVTALDGPGSEGLGLRQTYTVTMVLGSGDSAVRFPLARPDGGRLFAVPSYVGPRTMGTPADYAALAAKGIFDLQQGVKVFAGTTDDAFWIDLGATFDSLNLRVIPSQDVAGSGSFGSTGIPAVLTDAQDQASANFVTDAVSGYNVNTIALEVPIPMLTRTRTIPEGSDPAATLGTWGTTSRPIFTIRQGAPRPDDPTSRLRIAGRTPGTPSAGGDGILDRGAFRQVQRMGNPLFNELIIGTGFKDLWSRSHPRDDAQFASFALDPLLARVAQAAYGGTFEIPAPPRTDLLPLVLYQPPVAAPGTPPGPVADLLRLNIGVPPTPPASASRLGLIGGDPAGFPNGRRVFDDVTDIALRVVVGGVLASDSAGHSLNRFPNNRLGDGVNVNDLPYQNSFPFVGFAQDGRNRRHRDPGESGGGPVN
jgi:hypothetical protein